MQPLLRKTSGLPSDIEPSMYDANIYEIVSMYVAGIKQAGVSGKADDLDADRTKIRDYLTNLKGFEGFGGPISFTPDGDAAKTFFIVQGQNGAWTEPKRALMQRRGRLLISRALQAWGLIGALARRSRQQDTRTDAAAASGEWTNARRGLHVDRVVRCSPGDGDPPRSSISPSANYSCSGGFRRLQCDIAAKFPLPVALLAGMGAGRH